MRCLAVTTSYPADALTSADRVIHSFVGLQPEALTALFPER
jgi:hypothetical protein